VFQNRVLRRIFGPKMDEIIGGSKNLYNEELHNFRMLKSMRMKWAGHVGRMRR
jgi:hypothetical protein